MDESKESCKMLDDINEMIEGFHQDLGRAPKGLVMGMGVALHVIEHLKEEGLYLSDAKELKYRDIPIRVVGWEDCCFIEIEPSQIFRFRELKKAYEQDMNPNTRDH